jgi:hypothetical protein
MLFAGCRAATSGDSDAAAAATEAEGAAPPTRSYDAIVAAIEGRRLELAEASIASARREVLRAIDEDLFPAWLDTAWAFHGTATEPQQEGGIACGYFVATILQHAGLRLSSRTRFGQAAALDIQRALTPDPAELHRIFSVPADEVAERIRGLGDGLYIVGLNVHVGFVVVKRGTVQLVHSSYTDAQRVVREPLGEAEAIHNSRKAGYFVTPLFASDALVESWRDGRRIAAPA